MPPQSTSTWTPETVVWVITVAVGTIAGTLIPAIILLIKAIRSASNAHAEASKASAKADVLQSNMSSMQASITQLAIATPPPASIDQASLNPRKDGSV